MRRYTTQNRRTIEVVHGRSLLAIIQLVELSEEEVNDIVELEVGEDLLIEGWFYIERTD